MRLRVFRTKPEKIMNKTVIDSMTKPQSRKTQDIYFALQCGYRKCACRKTRAEAEHAGQQVLRAQELAG